MQQFSDRKLLQQKAPTLPMHPFMFSSSNQFEGSYRFSELDQFCGWPNAVSYSMQKSLGESFHRVTTFCDDHSNVPAKKMRLTMDQAKSLENNFAIDNRLEPERKRKLALELGLQPRQVAIWYQNRRARTKTKHLEEKYEALDIQYKKALEENRKLEEEVHTLRGELQSLKEKNINHGKPVIAQGDYSLLSAKQTASFPTNQGQQCHFTITGSSNQEINSEDDSNESTQNKPASSTSSLGIHKRNQRKCLSYEQALELDGMPPNEEREGSCTTHNQMFEFGPDNHLYYQQQHQQELLQHLQHEYGFGSFRDMISDVKLGTLEYLGIPSSSLAHFDGSLLLDEIRFKLEDDAAQHL